MSQHIIPVRTNLIIFAVLMGLLVLTVVVALGLELGLLEIPIALTIALVKAVLIMMYFMHLKFSNKLTWLFAGASTLWLAILISITMADYLSRDWIRTPVVPAGGYFGGPPDQKYYYSTFETTGKTLEGDPPPREIPESQ